MFFQSTLIAQADAPSIGLTTLLTIGTHDELHGGARLPVIPAPLLQIRVPLKRFELSIEGVPPIGPVPYSSDMPGVWRATKLSYGYAAVQYKISGIFSIGIGETLYNQSTIYTASHSHQGFLTYPFPNGQLYPYTSSNSQTQVDSSRVPGARYELQARLPLSRDSWLTANLSLTPAMHAVVRTTDRFDSSFATTAPIMGGHWSFGTSFSDPETASEVDASLGAAHRTGPLTIVYGIRYLNYVARFNFSGRLADRNTLLLPFIGIERTIGR